MTIRTTAQASLKTPGALQRHHLAWPSPMSVSHAVR
jgi:hypothetical protein